MDTILEHTVMLNQLLLTLLLLIPIVLISRTVVAGTRFSPILVIVLFGLSLGWVLVKTTTSSPGLPDFPIVQLVSRTTIIALIASFFVGGMEIRKILLKKKLSSEDFIVMSDEEILLGTKRTQMVFIIRSFFILLGIEGLRNLINTPVQNDILSNFYPLLAYVGIMGALIFIDHKAFISNKPLYLRKGVIEIIAILALLFLSLFIAKLVKPYIGLPQIFFAMILSSTLGFVLYKWVFGPTLRALLFAGIPIVLAANFLVGGSRIIEAFAMADMKAVISFGFFGQIFWMFGGIALLMFFGKTAQVRNLAPGMAGSLSHSGLTGACTAGDLGDQAATRAPIMINVPFLGHIFVFSVLAASAKQDQLLVTFVLPIVLIGVVLTALSLRLLKNATADEAKEIKGLMLFSFGWQICAVFGSFLMLHLANIPISDAAMATSSAISHFGLFAATQGGMFGERSAMLIPFIFAMPFLVHPLVFGLFGKGMENNGSMPKTPVYFLFTIGLLGIIFSLVFLK